MNTGPEPTTVEEGRSVDVCHVSTTFNRRSGSGRRTLAIAEYCHSHGISTTLAFGPDNDMADYDGPVPWTVLPSLRKPLRPFRDVQAYGELKKHFRCLSPRIIHTHLAKAGIVGRAAASALTRKPLVLHTVHGPTFDSSVSRPLRTVYRTLETHAAKRTDVQVYVGEDLRHRYRAAGVLPRFRDLVIRTGKVLPTDSHHVDRRRGRDELKLIYVARIVPMKQHLHAIDLLERLVSDGVDARMEFVGEALVAAERGYREELMDTVASKGLSARVEFAGHVTDVHDRLSEADIALLVSRFEGLPNVAVESMLAGTPMVAYDVPGVREVLGEELQHLVVPRDDRDALQRAVSHVLDHVEQTRTAVDVRRMHLRETYALETMLSSKLALYEQLLADATR